MNCVCAFHVQCRAGLGACPDTLDSSGTCTNDISDVSGSVADGKQCVSFTRPLSTCKRYRYCLSIALRLDIDICEHL